MLIPKAYIINSQSSERQNTSSAHANVRSLPRRAVSFAVVVAQIHVIIISLNKLNDYFEFLVQILVHNEVYELVNHLLLLVGVCGESASVVGRVTHLRNFFHIIMMII